MKKGEKLIIDEKRSDLINMISRARARQQLITLRGEISERATTVSWKNNERILIPPHLLSALPLRPFAGIYS